MCEIEVVEVRGLQTTGGVAIRITGTAADCSEVRVMINCAGSTGELDGIPVVDGSWLAEFTPSADATTQCSCNDEIQIRVECKDDPDCYHEFVDTLICCPHIEVSRSISTECDEEGRRRVTVSASIGSSAAGRLSARLMHAAVELDRATSTTGSLTLTHMGDYPPGTYMFTVEIIEPNGCQPPASTTITVEPCEDCPIVEDLTFTVSDRCIDGEREITVSARITPVGTRPVFVQWFHDSVSGVAASVSAPRSRVSSTYAYPADGSTHTATLQIHHPEGCDESVVTIGPVEPCPPPSDCPTIASFITEVEGCAGNGRSARVSFGVDLTSPASDCEYIWDFGDGSPNLITSVPRATHDYTRPGSFPASVYVECGDCRDLENTTVEIPPCCPTLESVTASEPMGCADGESRSASVEFVASTNPPAARGTFAWDFSDGRPPSPGTRTETNSYNQPGSHEVRVTFTPSDTGCMPSSASTNVSIMACSDPPPPSTDGGGSSCLGVLCGLLLAASLLFLTVAVILGFIAGCAWPNTFNYPMVYVFVGSLVSWALALIFLVIWGALCASFNCDPLIWLIRILAILTGIAALAAIILGALGNPCWLGSLFGSGYLGTALAVAIAIGEAVGCYGPRSGD